MKKKKNLVPLFIILGVIVLAAVLLLTVGRPLLNRTFASPVDYYRDVETKGISAAAKGAGAVHDTYAKYGNAQETGTITLELGETAKTLIQSYTRTDLSWLDNVAIDYNCNWKGDTISGGLSAALNGQKLATLDLVLDFAAQRAAMRVPELSDTYVDFSEQFSEVVSNSMDSSMGMQQMKEFAEIFPDQETATNMLNRYVGVILQNVTQVEKGNGTLSAEGVSMNCTTLTVTIGETELQNILRDICSTAQSDPDLRSMIMRLGDMVGEDLYTNFINELNDAAGEIGSVRLDGKIQMILYVDGSDRICGREISFVEADGRKAGTFFYGVPSNNGQFGFEVSITAPDTRLALLGSGVLSGARCSGTITGYEGDVPYFTVELRDFDLVAMKQGNLNGGITLRLRSAALKSLDTMTSAALSQLALMLDFNNSQNKADVKVALDMGGSKLATLHFEGTSGAGSTPQTFPNAVSVDEWGKSIQDDGSLGRFVQDLMGKLPAELKTMILG